MLIPTLILPRNGRDFLCSTLILQSGAGHGASLFCAGNDQPKTEPAMSDPSDPVISNPATSSPRITTGTRRPARARLVSRLWKTAEGQVAEIEARLLAMRDDPQVLERDAKTLAIIARTLRDLVALDAETKAPARKDHADEHTNPDAPRDLATFRAELARKLDELRGERAGDDAAGEPFA